MGQCRGTGRFLCSNGITMRCNRFAAPCRDCGWVGVTEAEAQMALESQTPQQENHSVTDSYLKG